MHTTFANVNGRSVFGFNACVFVFLVRSLEMHSNIGHFCATAIVVVTRTSYFYNKCDNLLCVIEVYRHIGTRCVQKKETSARVKRRFDNEIIATHMVCRIVIRSDLSSEIRRLLNSSVYCK